MFYSFTLSFYQGNLTPIREQNETGPQLVIWGTDVVVSQCKTKFRQFINNFTLTNEENIAENINSSEPLYLQELQQVLYIEMLPYWIFHFHLFSFRLLT